MTSSMISVRMSRACHQLRCSLQQRYALKYTIMLKTEHFTLCVKDIDTTKIENIKSVVLQSWHIFTRTRTFTMFHLKCKIVPTCDFSDRNPLKLSLSVWPVQVRKKKRQEGRKVIRSVYFTYAWSDPQRADSNQTWQMCSSHGRYQSFIVITWDVSELWGVEVSMLP